VKIGNKIINYKVLTGMWQPVVSREVVIKVTFFADQVFLRPAFSLLQSLPHDSVKINVDGSFIPSTSLMGTLGSNVKINVNS